MNARHTTDNVPEQQGVGGHTEPPQPETRTVNLPKTIYTRDVIAQSPVTYKKYTEAGKYAPRFTPLPDSQWGAAWPDSIDYDDSLLVTSFRSSTRYRR